MLTRRGRCGDAQKNYNSKTNQRKILSEAWGSYAEYMLPNSVTLTVQLRGVSRGS